MRLKQTKPSQVRIDRTKMMRSAYVNAFKKSKRNDLEKLAEELNRDEEIENLKRMLAEDSKKS